MNLKKTVDCHLIDFQASSNFVYQLVKAPYSTALENHYQIQIYDINLLNVRSININNQCIPNEILNMKISDKYIFLYDRTAKVTLIDINNGSYVRSFILNGRLFSFYSESLIISYNIYSKLLWYYNLEGTIKYSQKIDNEVNPYMIKVATKKLLFYDKTTDDIYYQP